MRIKAKYAKWKYELFGDPTKGPLRTTYEAKQAIKALRSGRKVQSCRITHLDTGLITETDQEATLIYLKDTLIDSVGHEHAKSKRYRTRR